ncbi:hypothetical protein B9Z19DRAFT_1070968 [Tuber borchii]|uniref:Uncharacterized protein n=1 Tax=Tuber borchii TaxID=42251 RepID=A0A2T7A8N5_TUBBO|nr:hypothetical protein B9Z19DRAFT_1070968 [Tuber borchii]
MQYCIAHVHACLLFPLGWLHPVSESDPAAGDGGGIVWLHCPPWCVAWLVLLPILYWSPPAGALNPADWIHRIISESKARHTVITGKRSITDRSNSSSHHKPSGY